MTMCIWSERVAMLLDEEDAATRAHVKACSACAELLAELEGDRAMLRAMPVPAMAMAVPRRRRVVWPWAAGALAATLAVTAWFWPEPAPVAPMQIAISAPAATELRPVVTKPAPVPRRATPAPLSLAAALEAALPPHSNPPVTAKGDVVIAMQTEDPNVLIVLVGDSDD